MLYEQVWVQVCAGMCANMFASMYEGVCAYVWGPEVSIACLPHLFKPLFSIYLVYVHMYVP